MAELKLRDGEFIGAGMSAEFIKDKIDTAHVRGYAVLVVRATSPDAPDKDAVYNLYQVDDNRGRASGDMYEACKLALDFMTALDAKRKVISGLSLKLNNAVSKAEGKEIV